MSKFKITKEAVLSVGVAIGTVVLAILKTKDDANKDAAKKEEWITEALNRMNNEG